MRCTSLFLLFCIVLAYARDQTVLDASNDDPNKQTPGDKWPAGKGWMEIKEFSDDPANAPTTPQPAAVPRPKKEEFVDPDYVDYVAPQQGQPGYGEGPVVEAEPGTPDVVSYDGLKEREEAKKAEEEAEQKEYEEQMMSQQEKLQQEAAADADPFVYPELRDVPEPLGSTGVIRFDASTLTGTNAHLLDLALKNTVVPEYDIKHPPITTKISKEQYLDDIEKARQDAILQDEAVDAKIQHSRDQLYNNWAEDTMRTELAKQKAEEANSDAEKYLTPTIVDKHGHPIDDLREFYGAYPGNEMDPPQAFPSAPDYIHKDAQQEYFRRLIEEQKAEQGVEDSSDPIIDHPKEGEISVQQELTVEGQVPQEAAAEEGAAQEAAQEGGQQEESTESVDAPEPAQEEQIENKEHKHHAKEVEQQERAELSRQGLSLSQIEKHMKEKTMLRKFQEKQAIHDQVEEEHDEEKRGDVDETTAPEGSAQEAIKESLESVEDNQDNALAAANGYDINTESPPPVVDQVIPGLHGAAPFDEVLPVGAVDSEGVAPGGKLIDKAKLPINDPSVEQETPEGTIDTTGDPASPPEPEDTTDVPPEIVVPPVVPEPSNPQALGEEVEQAKETEAAEGEIPAEGGATEVSAQDDINKLKTMVEGLDARLSAVEAKENGESPAAQEPAAVQEKVEEKAAQEAAEANAETTTEMQNQNLADANAAAAQQNEESATEAATEVDAENPQSTVPSPSEVEAVTEHAKEGQIAKQEADANEEDANEVNADVQAAEAAETQEKAEETPAAEVKAEEKEEHTEEVKAEEAATQEAAAGQEPAPVPADKVEEKSEELVDAEYAKASLDKAQEFLQKLIDLKQSVRRRL